MSRVTDAIERAADLLDRESAPGKLSIPEAIEFWEGIVAEADGRLDALREDLARDEAGEDVP